MRLLNVMVIGLLSGTLLSPLAGEVELTRGGAPGMKG
jgi:hypothetical protein